MRYIDDIIAIWTHDEPSLRTFVEKLNCHHPTINYTASWSAEETIHLDTRVYLKNGRIKPNLHTKPTEKHQYLCMESCHPKHCKTAILYSQAVRPCRICFEEENLLNRTSDLKHYFQRRGYNEQLQYLIKIFNARWTYLGRHVYDLSGSRKSLFEHLWWLCTIPIYHLCVQLPSNIYLSFMFLNDTKGISNTTPHRLLSPPKIQGPPGMGILNINIASGA